MKLLSFALCLFTSTAVLANSSWIEDRERFVGEQLVNIGACGTEVHKMGRVEFKHHRAFLAFQDTYESYQVKITQGDGYFAAENEELLAGTTRSFTRLRVEKKRFRDIPDCEFWTETSRGLVNAPTESPADAEQTPAVTPLDRH